MPTPTKITTVVIAIAGALAAVTSAVLPPTAPPTTASADPVLLSAGTEPTTLPVPSASEQAARKIPTRYALPVKGKRQERWNWCGPAAVQTAMRTAHGIANVTQATLAKDMGTDRVGFTSPGAMWREMNEHVAKTGLPNRYQLYRSISDGNLWRAMRPRIHVNREVAIILVQANKIWWKSARPGTAHYLVIYGYDENYKGKGPHYRVYDPADGSHRSLHRDHWGKVAFPGFFVITAHDPRNP